MPRYQIKANYNGKEWGEVFGYIEADTKEEAVKLAENGEIEWDYFKALDQEVEEIENFEVLND